MAVPSESTAGTPLEATLGANGIDRRSDARTDPTLVSRLLEDPRTGVLRLVGDRFEVIDGPDGATLAVGTPDSTDLGELVIYLGDRGDQGLLAVISDAPDLGPESPAELSGPGEVSWHTLRSVGADLPEQEASLAATTLALANWHRTHRHCSQCGEATEPVAAGWVRRCPSDGSEHYPRTDVAVIVAVVDDDDRLLLAAGRGFRPGGMSVLAGFVEPGETLAAAVIREVHEESGVEVTDPVYLGDQPWPFPSSLMVGFRARARTTELSLQDDEIESARWFTRAELSAAVADGTVLLPGRLSIARRLIEHWFGHRIDTVDVAAMRPGR